MDDAGTVVMRIPADARYIRLVRLAGSGMAALCGFDVEMIDDLKIAIGEMCATLMEIGNGGAIEVSLRAGDDGSIAIGAHTAVDGEAAVDEARFALSRQILTVIADEHRFDVADDLATFAMSMSVRPAAVG